ncbi:MAG: thiolase C-terminal domain-containing protein [Mycobacterium sp.]
MANIAVAQRTWGSWSSESGVATPASRSGPQATRVAGSGVADIDVAERYDCYTYTVLVTLETKALRQRRSDELVSDGRVTLGRHPCLQYRRGCRGGPGF